MTCYDQDAAKTKIINNITNLADLETNNDGQLVINSGIYRWRDGSYHNVSEDMVVEAVIWKNRPIISDNESLFMRVRRYSIRGGEIIGVLRNGSSFVILNEPSYHEYISAERSWLGAAVRINEKGNYLRV